MKRAPKMNLYEDLIIGTLSNSQKMEKMRKKNPVWYRHSGSFLGHSFLCNALQIELVSDEMYIHTLLRPLFLFF